MYKDFDRWNEVKKHVDLRRNTEQIYFKERDVWWCSLGINIGDEENGKGVISQRPILVLRKFNARIFLGIPMSTKLKPQNPFYFSLICPDGKQEV